MSVNGTVEYRKVIAALANSRKGFNGKVSTLHTARGQFLFTFFRLYNFNDSKVVH